MTINLLPHQQTALEKMSNGKVLVGGVGTGKTVTALVYFYTKVLNGTVGELGSIRTPTDIYVFTTARKRDELDWQRWAAQLGIGRDRNASVGGIQLVVDSYNNIGNYTAVHGAFIILDEQRMVGSGSWVNAFLHMAKSNHWIMLSATPGDVWEDYIPLFIANGFYKNRTAFKREHIVYNTFSKFPKVDHYVSVGKLLRLRNSILVEMPYERHTTRHVHRVEVNYNKELFEKVVKKRWNVYEERPLRDVAELFSVMRKVVNSDISRLETVLELMKTHPRLIVFYNFDYELEILRTLMTSMDLGSSAMMSSGEKNSVKGQRRSLKTNSIQRKSLNEQTQKPVSTTLSTFDETPNLKMLAVASAVKRDLPTSRSLTRTMSMTVDMESGFTIQKHSQISLTKPTIAEWNGHNHDPLPTSDRWVYLVQYVAGAEAWNCTTTNAVVFWSLTYSYKIFEQAKGRIDRLDTPFHDLHYYVLLSKSAIDRAISRSLSKKESFNQRKFGVL